MNVTVPIFHRKKDGLLTWASVGLGGLGFAIGGAETRDACVADSLAAVISQPAFELRDLCPQQFILPL